MFAVQRRSCKERRKRRWKKRRERSGLSRNRLVEHRENKGVKVKQVTLLSCH